MTLRSIIAALTTVAAILAVVPAALAADRTYVVIYENASVLPARAAVRAAGVAGSCASRAVGVASHCAPRGSGFEKATHPTDQRAIRGAAPNQSIGSVPAAEQHQRQVGGDAAFSPASAAVPTRSQAASRSAAGSGTWR